MSSMCRAQLLHVIMHHNWVEGGGSVSFEPWGGPVPRYRHSFLSGWLSRNAETLGACECRTALS